MTCNPDSTKPAHEGVFSLTNVLTLQLHLTTFLLTAFNPTNI